MEAEGGDEVGVLTSVGSEQVGPPQPGSQEQAQRLRSNTPWRLQRLRTSVWPGAGRRRETQLVLAHGQPSFRRPF